MYVATIAVSKNSHSVHIDSSIAESIETIEAVSGHKGVKNVFRTIVDENAFVEYSNGAEFKADIEYGILGQPTSITVSAC